MSQNILVIGGSRHIGYFAAIRFLDAGSHVTFLLRHPENFDSDEAVQTHVKSGKAHLVKGDGLVRDDVQKAWDEAGKYGPVDALLFTVGFTGNPKFSLTGGFKIDPANLVTQCLLNALSTYPAPSLDHPPPKLIMLSTVGVTRFSRSKVNILLKILYGYLIAHPLRDKRACERIIYHLAGWDWKTQNEADEPPAELTGPGSWKDREGLPAAGSLKKQAMIVRAAGLNDGKCVADEGKEQPYRVEVGEISGSTPWGISRQDVGHFIFEAVSKPEQWEKWGGNQVSVSY